MRNKQLPGMLPSPPPGCAGARRGHPDQKSKTDDEVIQEVAQTGAVTATSAPYVPDRHTGDQNGIGDNHG